ncbi:hypothetical protein [Eikenella sp. Marseille-P7795]|uniref:hypothetical protein n=1 Tax=Eikenella sp. Marseille-P7795 TaxID=2866577 RepID=UPI001CE4206B|nr:hypothetical protein [Eikenella sp. Marseille-P7795]
MHKREDDRYAPPLSVAEEADVVANVEAGRLPAWRAFVWFGTAWALFWQRAGWWFGLVLAWTILSSVLAALAELITPTLISFFPAVHDFAVVFATAGAAYAAERVGRKVRVDWRAGLVVLVRCAGALALLGLLNVVFDQLLLRVEGLLGIYVVNMRGKPSSLLSGAADWIMYWNWLFFILAYLLPNGVAPVLVVCRRAGWRGLGRRVGAEWDVMRAGWHWLWCWLPCWVWRCGWCWA